MKKPVHIRIYRKMFFNFMIFTPALILVAYFLRKAGIRTNGNLESVQTSNFLLIALIVAFILVAILFRFRRSKFREIKEESLKLRAYQQYYMFKLWIYLGLTLVISLAYVLTGNKFFLYFALFELVAFVFDFPFKAKLKKDLEDDNIIFV